MTAGQYPIVFVPTGQWELTYCWPGHTTERLQEPFAAKPKVTFTFGYGVYRSTECTPDHSGARDRTICAKFYVYPDGTLISGLGSANGPTQPNGDMGTLTGRAPNDTSVPQSSPAPGPTRGARAALSRLPFLIRQVSRPTAPPSQELPTSRATLPVEATTTRCASPRWLRSSSQQDGVSGGSTCYRFSGFHTLQDPRGESAGRPWVAVPHHDQHFKQLNQCSS